MSQIKRLIEEKEHQRDVATEIAIEAGVLKRCSTHGEVYDPLAGDNVPAYKLGNYKFSKGELRDVFPDRPTMTAEIDAAVKDSADECHTCANWRDE